MKNKAKKFISLFIVLFLVWSLILNYEVAYAGEFREKLYSQESNRTMFDDIKDAITNVSEEVDITEYYKNEYSGTDITEFENIMLAKVSECERQEDKYGNVEAFVVNHKIRNGEVSKVYVTFKYIFGDEEMGHKKDEIAKVISDFKENYIRSYYNDFQKEIAVINYITENCEYDSNSNRLSHNAYAALVNKKAVCDGYSRAMNLLFDACDLESYFVGSNEICHAWSKVKIDNEYYNVDVTSIDSYYDYSFLNLSDTEMSQINKASDFLNDDSIPKCNTSNFEFFRKNIFKTSIEWFYPAIYDNNSGTIYIVDNNTLESRDIYGNTKEKILNDSQKIITKYQNNIIYEDSCYNIKSVNLDTKKITELIEAQIGYYFDWYSINGSEIDFEYCSMHDLVHRKVDLSLVLTNKAHTDEKKNDQENKKMEDEIKKGETLEEINVGGINNETNIPKDAKADKLEDIDAGTNTLSEGINVSNESVTTGDYVNINAVLSLGVSILMLVFIKISINRRRNEKEEE